MILYVCLILLPASALACEPVLTTIFFGALDEIKDGEVQRSEANHFYEKLNKDGDDCLTLAETREQAPTVAPLLAGKEEPLYDIVDMDSNGCITESDVDLLYITMDTNRNGAVSKPEYDRALRILCLPDTLLRLLTGRGNNKG